MSELVGQSMGNNPTGKKYKCIYADGSVVFSSTPCSLTNTTQTNVGVSTGFGTSRGSDVVVGLGGSQIQRAEVGNSVTFNPLYNKPMYVVSPSMRALRKRQVRSQRPLVQLNPSRK
mgnify:FL=1